MNPSEKMATSKNWKIEKERKQARINAMRKEREDKLKIRTLGQKA